MDIDRDEFGARQADMTARWYENVKATYGDVDAYIATRGAAYLDRWSEAARFIADGSRVLDIGGGNLFASLIEFLKVRAFRYSYLDVDPLCVDGSRNLAQSLGLEDATFQHGYNDVLPFAAESFDAVFSSHCLEHSFDMHSTFSEVNRVLAPGGNLLMAVPFGWESNPEHPYIFGPDDWITLVEDAGFQIRVAQIGREYPELGCDYFIAARKVSAPATPRLDAAAYQKTGYTFVPFDDPSIVYRGERVARPDHVIMTGDDWHIAMRVPDSARDILPVLQRHDWSGIAELRCGGRSITQDLYSWFPYAHPVRLARAPGSAEAVEIRPAGRNPSSHAAQCVVFGVMYR